jgi:hypothetical protein
MQLYWIGLLTISSKNQLVYSEGFMAFEIAPRNSCFKSCPSGQSSIIELQQSLFQHDALPTRTYDPLAFISFVGSDL